MPRIERVLPIIHLAAAIFLTFTSAAWATDEFYKGKRITLLIGVPPGGGYDVYARLLARHLGRHIPGNPTVIAENMPGAGGLRSAGFLYSVAPKDGTYLGAVVNGVPFAPLFGEPNAHFDATKFSWIGNLNQEVNLLVVRSTLPAKTLSDLTMRETIIAATPAPSTAYTFPVTLNALLGTKLRIISGYPSSAEGFLAMEQGEVDGRAIYWSVLKSAAKELYDSGKLRILVQGGLTKHPELPNVPLALDMAKNDEDRSLMEVLFASLTIGRPILGPPDIPAQRKQELRAAFDATVADPDFIAEAEKLHLELRANSGSEVENIISRAYATSPAIVKKAKELIW